MSTEQPYRPHPAEMAHFDQAHAKSSQALDRLIQAHRGELAESGETRELCIVGLANFLLGESDAEFLASLLAVAVDRLAGQNDTEVS